MFLFGGMLLLVTAWVVSDNAPGTPTGWVAPTFIVLGLLYGGVMQSTMHLQEGDANPTTFLAGGLTFLLPLGLVVWGADAWMEGTAYAYLGPWCWWTLGGCAVLIVGGWVYRLTSKPG